MLQKLKGEKKIKKMIRKLKVKKRSKIYQSLVP
jgi:hypothetical protein